MLIELRDLLVRFLGLGLFLAVAFRGLIFLFESDIMLNASHDGNALTLFLFTTGAWVAILYFILIYTNKIANKLKS
jgi:hypothetical protein